jgi:hypothetical protein
MKFDAEQFMKDVSINDADLSGAILTHASLFAHYAVMDAQAQHQVDKLKLALDVRSARADKKVREGMANSGIKVTESGVEQEIKRSAEYLAAVTALNAAKEVAAMTHTALDAFRQRRDMLIQLGVAAREEMKGEVRVLNAEAAKRNSEELRARALGVIQKGVVTG